MFLNLRTFLAETPNQEMTDPVKCVDAPLMRLLCFSYVFRIMIYHYVNNFRPDPFYEGRDDNECWIEYHSYLDLDGGRKGYYFEDGTFNIDFYTDSCHEGQGHTYNVEGTTITGTYDAQEAEFQGHIECDFDDRYHAVETVTFYGTACEDDCLD